MPETDIFPLTPIYPIERQHLPGIITDEAESGRVHSRLKRAPRRVHQLTLVLTPEQKQQLEQWYDQHQDSWFSLLDPVFGKNADSGEAIERYFSVRFSAPVAYSLRSFNRWEAQCQLTDVVGAALYQYPDPDGGHVSSFVESEAGYIVAGTWGSYSEATAHGGAENRNDGTSTTDTFAFVYAGYGFRVWARKGTNLGIMNVYADSLLCGAVDLYAAAATVNQAVLTYLNLPLGLHTITLVATNTKNAASSAKTILADAIEAMA